MNKCKKCGQENYSTMTNCSRCGEKITNNKKIHVNSSNTLKPKNQQIKNNSINLFLKNIDPKVGIFLIIISFLLISSLIHPVLIILVIIASIIFLYYYLQEQKKRKLFAAFLHFNINDLDSMTGVEFENILVLVYSALGYDVETTPVTGDYGIDLILKNNSRKIGIQAKRYAKKLDGKPVQEVVAGLSHYNLSEAWVVTNNYFTKNAMILANDNNVHLVDRDSLVQEIQNAHNAIKKSQKI